jgi:hypothetical protein
MLASTTAGVMSWASPTLQYVTDFGATTTNSVLLQNAVATVMGKDETALTPNIAGSMKMWSAGDNAFYNTFTSGTNTANATYTLPTAMPTVNGQVLSALTTGVMSWTSGGSIPAPGSDTYMIFNDAGVFGADKTVQYDKSTYTMTLGFDETTPTANKTGILKIISAGDTAFYNTITAGVNTANATYTLPVAMPGANNLALISSNAGVMSWNNQAVLTTSDTTFNSVTVSSFLALTGITAEPLTLIDGMVWYRSDLQEFHVRTNSTTYKLAMTPV